MPKKRKASETATIRRLPSRNLEEKVISEGDEIPRVPKFFNRYERVMARPSAKLMKKMGVKIDPDDPDGGWSDLRTMDERAEDIERLRQRAIADPTALNYDAYSEALYDYGTRISELGHYGEGERLKTMARNARRDVAEMASLGVAPGLVSNATAEEGELHSAGMARSRPKASEEAPDHMKPKGGTKPRSGGGRMPSGNTGGGKKRTVNMTGKTG